MSSANEPPGGSMLTIGDEVLPLAREDFGVDGETLGVGVVHRARFRARTIRRVRGLSGRIRTAG